MLRAQRMRANNYKISENVKLRQRYEHDAMVDGLTGVFNRRWLDEKLPRFVRRYRVGKQPLCLLLLDIAHFKRFNDDYGHAAGDRVLKAVADEMGERLLPGDFVARYGGEEFVVLLFDSTMDYARTLAEKIRRQVLAQNIEHAGSSAARCVSVSIGLAHIEPWRASRSIEGFVQMADEALYAAKEGGRNRVVEADTTLASTTTGLFRAMRGEDDADESGSARPVAGT